MVSDARGVFLKSPKEMELLSTSGRLLAEVVAILKEQLKPGMTTRELDAIAEVEIKKRRVMPAFKGYPGNGQRPFPACLCISINDEIVHGIPGGRMFMDGDVVSVDAGLIYRGFYSDSAFTAIVGKADPAAQRLVDTTYQAMMAGIAKAAVGARLGDVAAAIQAVAEAPGYGVIRKYVGHGVGRSLHEAPAVPNYGTPGTGLVLRPGLCIAIEPMVTGGSYECKELDDGWTVSTADGSLAAHFEHTILITENGPTVLTSL